MVARARGRHRYRRRLTIQEPTEAQDAGGGPSLAFTDLVTRWGDVEPVSGREYFVASGEHSDVNVRIRMRYDRALRVVKTHDRIVDATYSPAVAYDIRSVINENEADRELVFMCRRDG